MQKKLLNEVVTGITKLFKYALNDFEAKINWFFEAELIIGGTLWVWESEAPVWWPIHTNWLYD